MLAHRRKNIFIFFIILCCLLSSYSFGQNTDRILQFKDSLRNSFDEVEKRKLLSALGYEFSLSYPDSTIYYCDLALDGIHDSRSYDEPRILSLNYLGIANSYLGNNNRALIHFQEAIKLAMESQDSLLWAKSANFLSWHFLKRGAFAKAYEHLVPARAYFEKRNNASGMSEVYLNFADLFKSQHDYPNALGMAQRSLVLKNGYGDRRGIIQAHYTLGSIYQRMGDLTNAEVSYHEAEFQAGELEDEASLALVRMGLGELYLETGSLSKAESDGFRAENIVQRLRNPSLVSRSSLLLGRIFLRKKNFSEAEAYFTKSLEISEATDQIEIFMETNFYLARLYELMGKDKLASGFESTYRKLNDSMRNNELALQAEKFNYELTIKTSQQENELLKANELRNEATIKFQKIMNFGALFVMMLVLFFSYFLWQASRARKRVNKKLYEQNQELTDLNLEKDALMGIVAHDLKTPLANIKSILGIMPSLGPITPKQVELTNLMQETSNAGLGLIDELLDAHTLEVQKKPNYSSVDLSEMLKERIAHFNPAASNKNIQLSLEMKEAVLLNSDKDWLVRILDNLISNALKFSPQDSPVQVGAGITDQEVWITIRDQGPGFSTSDKRNVFQKFKKLSARPTGGETSNGLGLSIVKTLVQRLRGTVSLISEKGEGAEFIIRLPLKVD